MRKNSRLSSVAVVSLALMMTLLPLTTLIATAAQEQMVQGPYLGKTEYPWPQYQHDNNHTGFSPGPGPKTNHVLWRFVTAQSFATSISIVDGMVYVAERQTSKTSPGTIYAFDADTGDKIWEYVPDQGSVTFPNPMVAKTSNATEYGPMYGSMQVTPSYLLVDCGLTYCLDRWDGSVIWTYPVNTNWYGPIVSNGRVITGGYDNVVRSIELGAGIFVGGQLRWENNLTEFSQDITGRVITCPAVVDGKIFLGSGDDYAYCLDEEMGDIIWTFKTGDIITHGHPSVADGKVYIGSLDTYWYCLDSETGAEIWKFKMEGGAASAAAVAYGKVYFGSYDENLYCVNMETGDLVWNYKTDGLAVGDPVVADNIVYAASGTGVVYALDAEMGTLVWDYVTGTTIEHGPSIADGKLYLPVGDMWAEVGGVICFGKGPTAIPLSLTSTSLDLGKSTVVSGSLLDQSPASPDAPVPGVSVILSYVVDGGTWTDFATVTTANDGSFSYEWTPPDEGIYTVTARFEGDDSYEWSSTEAKVQVGPAPPEFPDVPTSEEVAQEVIDQLPEYTTMSIVIAVAVIIAILIGLYNTWAIRKLRK